MDFQELPEHHAKQHLQENDLHADPFEQFMLWIDDAKKQEIEELNAMALATASKDGIPSCRMVLLKHFDKNGLVFFTNYESRKAKELDENAHASAVFFWPKVMLQICVEGKVKKISQENSKLYFDIRNRESQIVAWTSSQGKKISSRKELEDHYLEMKDKFEGEEIPLPSFWGGYRLIPNRFEFWQGGHHRLHDRFQYLYTNGKWEISRLSP